MLLVLLFIDLEWLFLHGCRITM